MLKNNVYFNIIYFFNNLLTFYILIYIHIYNNNNKKYEFIKVSKLISKLYKIQIKNNINNKKWSTKIKYIT